jgi:hypothetical protein
MGGKTKMKLNKKLKTYHPIGYSFSDTTRTLQRVSVHSSADIIVPDFRTFTYE